MKKTIDLMSKAFKCLLVFGFICSNLSFPIEVLAEELSNNEIIDVQGLFIYIGSTPNTNFLNQLEIETDKNFIKVDSNMKTNIKGIYAIGDVIKKDVYQLTTATSAATIAAISIKNYLSKTNNL